ncbi:prolyl oligopeptidase family serine peptidase [Pseudoalteromonas sp. SR44-5]|uniref:alpha/beta hydrolase-fold protein n=1 Tax=unclassified Pseudoalteromonas TaxID=194690 RepID=UPI0016018765|nr:MULTISPECIES: alpha/beta hydrolase-fold protein [unclassified Pseudoalteromonas]MBB1367735.1 prolyl oligopeptidase family serine peptidase [Pseudoalteromonas sp. SR44-5]MBB1419621.1 prolyl oligopeptidase family serine peptidase [Pseudoalteromonas sp. SG44-1]MBB1468370.1 prolyl oligopeptidase family serine peptidase [Pseudoalteromonas sp. SG41-5]
MRLLTTLCFVSFFVFSSQNTFAQSNTKQQSTDYSVHTHTFKSAVLNEERTVTVQLPKSYQAEPNKVYPVIYRLDGAGNIPLASAVIERLQNDNRAPEVIIVAIENTNRLRDMYPTVNKEPQGPVGEGGGADKFLAFFEQELIPLVNKNYRTHNYKVISGASAGGVFALYALQAKSELFQAHIAYSPAVWWNYGASVKSTKSFIAKTKELNSYVYINIGEEAGIMRERYDELQQAIQSHKVQGLRFFSDAFDGVSHNLTSVAGAFNAYHNLFLPKQMPISALTDDVASIDAYYQNLSQQWGEQISPPDRAVRSLGYNLTGSKQFTRAIEVFKYNIKNHPKSVDALSALSYGYEIQGDTRQALEKVESALAIADGSYPYVDYLQDTRIRLEAQLNKNL